MCVCLVFFWGGGDFFYISNILSHISCIMKHIFTIVVEKIVPANLMRGRMDVRKYYSLIRTFLPFWGTSCNDKCIFLTLPFKILEQAMSYIQQCSLSTAVD